MIRLIIKAFWPDIHKIFETNLGSQVKSVFSWTVLLRILFSSAIIEVFILDGRLGTHSVVFQRDF